MRGDAKVTPLVLGPCTNRGQALEGGIDHGGQDR